MNFSRTDVQGNKQQKVEEESKVQFLSMGGKFVPNQKVQDLRDRLIKFMNNHIYPMESEFYKLAQSSKRWTIHPEEEKLKELAKSEGLWNLFIPVCTYVSLWSSQILNIQHEYLLRGFDNCGYVQLQSAARARRILNGGKHGALIAKTSDLLLGAGLTNFEYGYLCEIMGRSIWAPQIFNCGAPDTGNMEVNNNLLFFTLIN